MSTAGAALWSVQALMRKEGEKENTEGARAALHGDREGVTGCIYDVTVLPSMLVMFLKAVYLGTVLLTQM